MPACECVKARIDMRTSTRKPTRLRLWSAVPIGARLTHAHQFAEAWALRPGRKHKRAVATVAEPRWAQQQVATRSNDV